jgi:ribosomal protein S28E/S33
LATGQNLLIEYTPGMRTHDREFVAQVRLRDAAGQPARRVMLRMGQDRVEEGDVLALHEGDRPGTLKTAPLPSRDRFAHVEATRDTVMAQTFFKSQPPSFLALRRAD